MEALKARLDHDFRETIRKCSKIGYDPHYFSQMLERHGAYDAAIQLIKSKKVPDGFTTLWELKRLDLTIEAIIVENKEYHKIFSPDIIDKAKRRLTEFSYNFRV